MVVQSSSLGGCGVLGCRALGGMAYHRVVLYHMEENHSRAWVVVFCTQVRWSHTDTLDTHTDHKG